MQKEFKIFKKLPDSHLLFGKSHNFVIKNLKRKFDFHFKTALIFRRNQLCVGSYTHNEILQTRTNNIMVCNLILTGKLISSRAQITKLMKNC